MTCTRNMKAMHPHISPTVFRGPDTFQADAVIQFPGVGYEHKYDTPLHLNRWDPFWIPFGVFLMGVEMCDSGRQAVRQRSVTLAPPAHPRTPWPGSGRVGRPVRSQTRLTSPGSVLDHFWAPRKTHRLQNHPKSRKCRIYLM